MVCNFRSAYALKSCLLFEFAVAERTSVLLVSCSSCSLGQSIQMAAIIFRYAKFWETSQTKKGGDYQEITWYKTFVKDTKLSPFPLFPSLFKQEEFILNALLQKSRLIGNNVEAIRKEARESEFELKQYARFSSG